MRDLFDKIGCVTEGSDIIKRGTPTAYAIAKFKTRSFEIQKTQ